MFLLILSLIPSEISIKGKLSEFIVENLKFFYILVAYAIVVIATNKLYKNNKTMFI